MKKLYLFFIIALLFSSILAFGQNPGEFTKDMKPKMGGSNMEVYEYFIPLFPILIDGDTTTTLTLYGYSAYKDNELIILTGYSSSPIIEKKLIQYRPFEIEIPLMQFMPFYKMKDDGNGILPLSQKVSQNFLFMQASYELHLLLKVKTTLNTYVIDLNSDSYNTAFSGKNYTLSSFKNINNSNSFPCAAIQGKYDKTKFSIYPSGPYGTQIKTKDKTYNPWELIPIELNRGEVFYLFGEGANADLGGSRIVSSKPLFVYSGNINSNLNTSDTNFNQLYELENPEIGYYNKYYVPPLKNNGQNPIFRIFPKNNNTKVFVGEELIGTISPNLSGKDSSWLEYKNLNEGEPAVIWSDQPINVVSYSTGIVANSLQNKPIQMSINPRLDNHVYSFITDFKTEIQSDYATIIVKSDSLGKIPSDLHYKRSDTNGYYIYKTIKDITEISVKEIIDPQLINTKEKILFITLQLEKDYSYEFICSNNLAFYRSGFNNEFNYLYENELNYWEQEIPDTLPPEPHYRLNGSGLCYKAETYVIDKPDNDTIRTNMALIQFNKNNSYNFLYHCDDFVPGQTDSVNWYVDVIDMSLDAQAVITFTDRAGNDTTIVVEYKARKMDLSTSSYNFGYVPVGESKTQKFTITNNADFDFLFRTISFGRYPYLLERKGFKLNFLFDTTNFILPNQAVDFEVTFAPKELGVFRDTLYLSDTTCYSDMKLVVAGNSDGTSVSESEGGFSITPNPASDYITLNVPPLEKRGLGGVLQPIQIFDIFGERVLSVETRSNVSLQRIDVSALPAGVYLLSSGSGVFKFMIMR